MSEKLTKALDNIMKKHGKGSVVVGDEAIEYKRISTGSLGLDIITGGGYPEGKHVEIMAPESSGKAQPLTSKVLTPSGWMHMGDLQIGSIISNVDGSVQEVIGIFPQGIQDVYRLTLDDGSSMECTKDHLFTVQTRDSELYQILKLSDMQDNGLVSANQTRKYKLPGIKPIEFNKKILPLHPYMMGFLLGDGCFSNKSFSTSDGEILNIFNNIIETEKYDLEVYKVNNSEYDYRYCKKSSKKGKKNIICEVLDNYDLLTKKAHNKFIPEDYMYTSVEDRLELLRGLMDSDGTIDDDGNGLSYTSTSISLAKNVRDLFRSFGFRAVVGNKITQYSNKLGVKTSGKKAYVVSIISDCKLINPFRLSRKSKLYEKVDCDKKKYGFRYITNIEKIGESECQCIKVSSPDALYITDDYIVTHNTTVAIYGMISAQKKYPNKRVVMIDAEHAFDRDYAEALGLKMDEVLIVQPDNGEQGLEIADELIESGEISFITIDSIAALTPKSEIDGEMGDSKMGLHARLMSQAFRKLTAKSNKTGTVVFWTNQLREKIGVMFGCLHADMPILFTDGRIETIRNVVENKIQGNVHCYNEITKKVEEKPIIDWHYNGDVTDNSDFITILTESIDGKGRFGITVTPDHKVLTNRGWSKAKDIDFSDRLVSKYDSIYNGEMRDFLRGCFVGDSTLKIRSKNTGSLTLQDSVNTDYLNWKLKKLESLGFKSSGDNKYQSLYTYEFARLKQKNGKRNPLLVFEDGEISDLTLAVWMMDDGNYKKHNCSYSISMKRFKNDDSTLSNIKRLFNLNGLECTYNLKNGTFNFNKDTSRNIANRICKYVPDSMQYKLPDEYKGRYEDFIIQKNKTVETDYVKVISKNVASDRKLRQKGKYDISIQDNHNYFSGGYRNGIIVHNSPEVTTGGNAAKFYASIRIDLRKKQGDKDSEGEVINSKVTAKTIKNKTAPPFKKCEFDIIFGEGIDFTSEILYYGEKAGIIQKSGSWYSYGDVKLGQGGQGVKTLLKDNPELTEELEDKIRKHYKI